MNHRFVFAFDLDGVLVDTLGTLYSAYLNILAELGATGSAEEFDFLNGKNVQEIAEHLKRTHGLACSESNLIERFQAQFDSLYSSVELIPGADTILEFLRANHVRLALASSSSRKNIDVILDRFELDPFFELIVSGDDVKQAKPSPDIYNVVKRHFDTNRCFVVEDSTNGIKAAQDAGLFTVHFNPGRVQPELAVSHTIERLEQIKPILFEPSGNSILISTCTEIELRTDHELPIASRETQTRVESIWQYELAQRPKLFNDPLKGYLSHVRTSSGKLVIESTTSSYKHFLAQLRDPDLELVQPLAVSGIAIDNNGQVLIGKRDRNVTEYPDTFEFVPSGGISSDPPAGQPFQQQLVIELEEESGIPLSAVEEIVPLGLTYDPLHRVYDIVVLVRLSIEVDVQSLESTEYSEFRLLDISELESFLTANEVVPTSRVIHSILSSGAESLLPAPSSNSS